MFSEKTQVDSHLDLSFYIEGLLNIPEPEIEVEQLLVEKDLKTLIEIENKVKDNKIQPDISEQSKIPEWGRQPFECLLVKLAGMDILVPAMTVTFIDKVNKKITRLPLEAEAFQGVITLRDKSIAVIDLFSLISKKISSNDHQTMQVEEHYINNVIVMEDDSYALSCDEVSEMIMLQPEDVRWNNVAFNNPMFCGVVPEYLCPIINLDSLNMQVAAMPFVQSLNERNN